NLKNKNGQAYTFDYGNRLRDVTGKESYAYDAYGRRTIAGRPTTRTVQVYIHAGQLFYTEASGKGNMEYVYLNGSLLATRNSGTIKFQHTDALGSPIAVTDTSGQVVERTDYQPYGSPIGKTVDGIGYTGHAMDGATGLTYMQQRYYDQDLGRFLSVDPVAADSVLAANFNRYRYASNNPYSFKDPDGRAEYYNFPNGVTVVIQSYNNKSQFSNAQIEVQASKFNGPTSGGKNMVVLFRQGSGADTVNISTNNALSDAPGSNNRSHVDKINGRNVEMAPDAVGSITVGHEMGHTLGAGDQYKGGVDAGGAQLSNDVPETQGAIMRDYGGQPASQQTRDEIENNSTQPGNKIFNCSSMQGSSCK
ncbi:RHS repeat-associated core domain-containing protein, partial [Xanthomonas citri]